jgi:benzoate-CoA ligase
VTAGAKSDWYNATVDLLERNLRDSRSAAAPYLIVDGRIWSYAEMAAASDGAGQGLLDLGLQAGDRILLGSRDRPEFVATFWGAIKAGLIPVPIAQGLASSDLDFMLSDSEARAAVCDIGTVEAMAPSAERLGVPCLFVGAEVPPGARSWEEVCGRDSTLAPARTGPDDIALWLYTSGTTGLPKAAMHRHAHLRDAPGALTRQVVGMGPDDRVLSVSKMFFAYGLGNSVYLPASAGASVVVTESPAIPARMAVLMEQTRPTVLFGVPAFFEGLAGLPDVALPSTVRMTISAGESLSEETFHRFRSRFGRELLDGLGATEALHHVTSNRPGDVVPGSAGPPLDGYDAQVLDRQGQPVPEGVSGELWVRGPTTFAGYWRRPELTERAFRGQWLRTGDLVHLREGRVFHEGRLDDLVKLGGVWVAPREIEEVLRGHPEVRDAVVVPSDDGSGVPVLRAFVVAEDAGSELPRRLSRLCRERLAAFKVPRSFTLVDELPRTPTGKLKRFVFREGQPRSRRSDP